MEKNEGLSAAWWYCSPGGARLAFARMGSVLDPPAMGTLAVHAVRLADKLAVVDDRPDGTVLTWTFAELNKQANPAGARPARPKRQAGATVWRGAAQTRPASCAPPTPGRRWPWSASPSTID